MKLQLRSLLALAASSALAADANRLTYLDDTSPFWPTPASPKFTTPQWVGKAGVDAVVVLAIDDMRDPAKYEVFLRPILDRLKRIEPANGGDGRAPVSIMTNVVKPDDPQLAAWLKEGLSLEVHTLAHPCPMLGKMSLDEAAKTYHGCVALLASVPGNKPVAFRMPCCDSMNSASPRFFAEIFSRASEKGNTLAIDSSVFALPPGERFTKYFPTELRPPMKKTLGDYAGFIDDYPYPYVIGKACWEFPCMVPSDWEAFNVLGAKSPAMLDDWKAALDYVVKRQGVFTGVFHPHGWSGPEQWIEFIDYAEKTYGRRVKFLTFREALERLEKHALADHPLRAKDGGDHGVRVLDLNDDGFMDIVIGYDDRRLTRVWDRERLRWNETAFPLPLLVTTESGQRRDLHVRFGVIDQSGAAVMLTCGHTEGAWAFSGGGWEERKELQNGLTGFSTGGVGIDGGVRFRDFDGDGVCELLHSNSISNEIYKWSARSRRWERAEFSLPGGVALLDERHRDNGLRFADLNGDGFDDIIQSNDAGHAIHLWAANVRADLGWKRGWSHLVSKGAPGGKVPPFVKDGRNYGAWFHRDSIVWQNEDLATPERESVRRTFKELVAFDVPPMKPPAESLAAMRPRPGFTVELVAAEPLVEGPVAFEWDARGRLWVAEMRDYPLGMDGKGQPGGRVKVLTDEDGDGRFDRADICLDGLPFPTGVMPWRDGALVFAVPDILFARDTDGDGRADERRVLFTGFKPGNQQHRANGFEWGLDGWIHGANGDSGGRINGVSISGRDFRFRPDTGEFEAESGQGQYGRRRDDWGNWFANNNPTWLWHYTIEDRYLRRNPRLAVKATKQVLADYADSTRVFAASALPIRFNQPQSLGHVTSACSPAPYRDELFGPDFAMCVFVCEPVHNVVHREVLTPDGATFTSRRADDERDREFLASADPWFRPVYAKTGPDGALYIADFYRFVLEHPEWIAPETQGRLDIRAGADKGRIYRIFPAGAKLRPFPARASLDSQNGWERDTAHRLLAERGEKAAPALLHAANPKVRVQAVAAIGADAVATAIRDAHPAVRVQALRASESLREMPAPIFACVDDPEFTVRRQLALTLGFFRDERAAAALAKLAEREGDNPQMRVAILSSLAPGSALFAKLNSAVRPAAVANIALPKPSTPDRAKVVASYGSVATLEGDAQRGHDVFKQQCFICHRLKGEGQEVGPDLAMVADKPLDWLLTAIFDPNAAVEDRYKAQTLKLKSGAEMAGLISAETANNIVLRLPGGVDLPVLRGDITSQQTSARSLMPEGLETVLKPQDVADLIAWLRKRQL